MNYSMESCVDVGTEQCPCALALTGDCLVCSRLRGKDCCDCRWQGVCVYNEFVQGGGRVNAPRQEFAAGILEKEEFGAAGTALTVLTLEVPKGFALRASLPGSFVFLRRKEDALWYSTPLSVLQADPEEGSIRLAVKRLSAKTKALLAEEKEFLVRGVYRSGIQGAERLVKLGRGAAAGAAAKGALRAPGGPQHNPIAARLRAQASQRAHALFITRGVGLAPGILAARYLAGRAACDFLIDEESLPQEFLNRYLPEGIGVRLLRFGTADPAAKLEAALQGPSPANSGAAAHSANCGAAASPEDAGAAASRKNSGADVGFPIESLNYDAAALLVSDYYQDLLAPVLRRALPGAALCLANNFRMCCGEGLCGACSYRTEDGEILKMCKCGTVF